MPSNRIYPDPSDGRPVFLSGELDLDSPDPVSPDILGEVLLNVRPSDKPLGFAPAVHAHARRAGGDSGKFMFGLLPEQAPVRLPDTLILHLSPIDQD